TSRALTITKPTFSGEISSPAMGPSSSAIRRAKQSMPDLAGGGKAAAPVSAGVHAGRRLRQHRLEHRRRQPPGIGVLARAMIAVEHDKSVGQRVPRAMRKGDVAPLNSTCIEDAVMGNAPDRQQRA